MNEEVWKDVVGYEDRYQVSNMGRLRSKDILLHKSDGKTELRKGRLLTLNMNLHGYYMHLMSNGADTPRKSMLVHRLVAMAFIPNPDNKPNIDHINTIRTDNRVENLRWCTQSENNRNPITMTRYRKKGEYRHSVETRKKIGDAARGKPPSKERVQKLILRGWDVVMFDLQGTFIKEYRTSSLAAKDLGICHSHITASCSGARKSAGGYQWKWKKYWNGGNIPPISPTKKVHRAMTEKWHNSSMRGLKNAHELVSKPIFVYRKDGTFVCECKSLSDAARKFNTNSGSVCRVCKGLSRHSKGFVFKYKNDNRRK